MLDTIRAPQTPALYLGFNYSYADLFIPNNQGLIRMWSGERRNNCTGFLLYFNLLAVLLSQE